jgi:hypothetical protein
MATQQEIAFGGGLSYVTIVGTWGILTLTVETSYDGKMRNDGVEWR